MQAQTADWKQIILQIVEQVLQTDHERLLSEVGHEIMDAKPVTIEEGIKLLGRSHHPNTETCSQVKHMQVMP